MAQVKSVFPSMLYVVVQSIVVWSYMYACEYLFTTRAPPSRFAGSAHCQSSEVFVLIDGTGNKVRLSEYVLCGCIVNSA